MYYVDGGLQFMEFTPEVITVILALCTALVIVVGFIYDAKSTAKIASVKIDDFETDYKSTQKEFRKLQSDVSKIYTQTAVLDQKANHTSSQLVEIKDYLNKLLAK